MGGLSIYARKDGRYEGRVYLGKDNSGKRKYRSYYGSSAAEVERKYNNTEARYIPSPEITQMTVKRLAEEWLFSAASRIKESTMANYRMKMEKHIIPAFGGTNIVSIRSADIYSFINSKIEGRLSVRYVSDILVLMKSIFKYAAREYGIKNVFDGITMPKRTPGEVKLLSPAEQNTLKNYISIAPSRVGLGIALAMYMGLRIGELCALRWEDIDLQKRILTVSKTIQRIGCVSGDKRTKLIITEPKSRNSSRIIPIPECIITMLTAFKSDEESYILTGTEKPMEPRSLQYRFTRILKKLGLPQLHFHSLRHLFASRAIELNFDMKTLSELLGHSSIELTMRLYVHSSLDRKKACMDKFGWS